MQTHILVSPYSFCVILLISLEWGFCLFFLLPLLFFFKRTRADNFSVICNFLLDVLSLLEAVNFIVWNPLIGGRDWCTNDKQSCFVMMIVCLSIFLVLRCPFRWWMRTSSTCLCRDLSTTQVQNIHVCKGNFLPRHRGYEEPSSALVFLCWFGMSGALKLN